jgi:hypothetical protein
MSLSSSLNCGRTGPAVVSNLSCVLQIWVSREALAAGHDTSSALKKAVGCPFLTCSWVSVLDLRVPCVPYRRSQVVRVTDSWAISPGNRWMSLSSSCP